MKRSFVWVSLFLAMVAVLVLAASACGDDDKNKVTIRAPSPISLQSTPYPTASVTEGPVPTRAVDFASSCQKSDAKQFSNPPPTIIDPTLSYTAVIKTEKGDITLELYPDVAPVTVNSFVFLACTGFYDGVTWHRVLPGFVAQAGDPTGTGGGGPGYRIPAEFSDLPFEKGTLGMARNQDPNSGGSQFFICLEPKTPSDVQSQTSLNGQYTVFGKVTAGLDVLEKITLRDPSTNPDLPPGDKILEITIEEG